MENGSCSVLFLLSASADRDLLMAENGIPHLLGDFRYFGCLLLHFDPVIVSDRFRLEHRRYRPIFQKKRIQRTAAGMRTTGGLGRVRRLSPVRLRSDHPPSALSPARRRKYNSIKGRSTGFSQGRGLLNVQFSPR